MSVSLAAMEKRIQELWQHASTRESRISRLEEELHSHRQLREQIGCLRDNESIVDELVLRVKGLDPSLLPSGDRISRCEDEFFQLRILIQQMAASIKDQGDARGQLADIGSDIAGELQSLRSEVGTTHGLAKATAQTGKDHEAALRRSAGVLVEQQARYESLEQRLSLLERAPPPAGARAGDAQLEALGRQVEKLQARLLVLGSSSQDRVDAVARVEGLEHRLEVLEVASAERDPLAERLDQSLEQLTRRMEELQGSLKRGLAGRLTSQQVHCLPRAALMGGT
eukprot:COSAG01_NODE_6049_length_3880_cov_7.107643_7_plen_283_part_00